MAENIPKRIIQTAKDRNLSPLARAGKANLQLLHPDWEYLFFDDADIQRFIENDCPEFKRAFYEFPLPIQKIDFFRYLAIYKLGGFYFDTDVFLFKRIDPLMEYHCVFPFEELTLYSFLRSRCDIDWEIGNYAFGAAAGHPFLKAIIDNCVRSQKDSVWAACMMEGIPNIFQSGFQVLTSTGPGLLTRTLAEHTQDATGVTVLFPANVCDSSSWHQFGEFGVHLMSASWRKPKSILLRKLGAIWEARRRKAVLAESAALGPRRTPPTVKGS